MLYGFGRTFDIYTLSKTFVSMMANKDVFFGLSETQRMIASIAGTSIAVTPMRLAWLVVGLALGAIVGIATYTMMVKTKKKEKDARAIAR